MALSPLFRPMRFADLPGWEHDDHGQAFAAFRRCALQASRRAYRTGLLGVAFEAFAAAYEEASRLARVIPASQAKAFFEHHFQPCSLTGSDGGTGFVTGYYEPQVEASLEPCGRFSVPLYRRPDDLVEIDDKNRPSGLDSTRAFARLGPDGLYEYYDRAGIESGALAGKGLEIAWLADAVDAFFIHVQGAAHLFMPDGSSRRVTYAAKTGHAFVGPGRLLVEMGEIDPARVSMQAVRAWLRENPGRRNEILWQNRSFIFFREAPVDDPELGPVAAAKVPLTPGRSIAVDRALHTFGTPFMIRAPSLDAFGDAPFQRLMIAQDTGSAIIGPARADLFAGSGEAAGQIAGVIRHEAEFAALVPRTLADGICP